MFLVWSLGALIEISCFEIVVQYTLHIRLSNAFRGAGGRCAYRSMRLCMGSADAWTTLRNLNQTYKLWCESSTVQQCGLLSFSKLVPFWRLSLSRCGSVRKSLTGEVKDVGK